MITFLYVLGGFFGGIAVGGLILNWILSDIFKGIWR